MNNPYKDKETLALYQVRSELAQLMGWLKDGDAFGRWQPFENTRIWIKDAEPVKATLDETIATLPPDCRFVGVIQGSEDDPNCLAWTAFGYIGGKHSISLIAHGNTEMTARFSLNVALWKRVKEL